MKSWTTTLALLALLFPLAGLSQTQYYRYKDKDGSLVMSSELPPEAANNGYDVLNSMGEVIEKVPPRKTEAELQKEAENQKLLQSQKQQDELKREQAKEQNRKDEILLKSFNSAADIERARSDKIASIIVLEEIMKENLHGLKKQLAEAQGAAATYQESKQPIPPKLQTTIDNTLRQIKESNSFLERKQNEKKEIDLKYKAILDRFMELQQPKTPKN